MSVLAASHPTAYSQKDCALCFESYDQKTPKILPCFHTFCEACLNDEIRKHSEKQTFRCPFCGFEIDKPKEGAAAFQTNLYITAGTQKALCEVCEDVQKADAKCVNCQLFLCRSCTTAHQKWKAMKDHRIENLLGNVNDMTFVPVSQTKPKTVEKSGCKLHKDPLDLFCTDCRTAACKQCKYIQHKKHTVVDMRETALRAKKNLVGMLGKNEQYIPWLNKRLTNMETEEKLRERTVIGRIKSHVKNIHKQVDDIAETLMEQVKVDPSGMKSGSIKSEMEVFSGQIQSAKTWLKNASYLDLILDEDVMIESMEAMPRNLSLSLNQQYEVDFKCGTVYEGELEKMIGETMVTARMPSELSIKQVTLFHIQGQGFIRCVCPVGMGRAWVTEFGSPGMTLYDEKGTILKFLFPGKKVDCVKASKKGVYIFASLPEEKLIYKINADTGEYRVFLELVYHPRGIAVASNGCLAVCSAVSKGFKEYMDFHINAVLICHPSGEVVKQIKTKESAPFAYPYRIAVNDVDDRIIVLDVVNSALYIFDRSGKVMKTYSKEEHGRDISDIACDRYGNIFLACSTDGCVEMLSANGEFVCVLLPTNILQGQPHSIAVSESGYLWLGFSTEIRVYKYLDFKQ